MQAVLFLQNFEDVYRAEAIVICNSRGDSYTNNAWEWRDIG